METTRTHYDNLKVAQNAPASVITAVHQSLCQSYHPSQYQGSPEEAARQLESINASYAVLMDPVARAKHDEWIRGQGAQTISNPTSPGGSSPTIAGMMSTPSPPYLLQRIFARLTDYYFSGLLLLLLLSLWGITGIPYPRWLVAELYAPDLSPRQHQADWCFVNLFFWAVMEPLFLKGFSTTPGKAVFGLRLVSLNPSPQYWRRSFAIWAAGLGSGHTILSFALAPLAVIRLKLKKTTDWDCWMGFHMEAIPLGILHQLLAGITAFAVLMACMMTLTIAVDDSHPNTQTPAPQAAYQPQTSSATMPATPTPAYQQPPLPPPVENARPMPNLPAEPSYTEREQTDENANPPPVAQVTKPRETPEQGEELFRQGRYSEALPLLTILANQGHMQAQFHLGIMYAKGLGIRQDEPQAVYWYERAAREGYPYAQYNLAYLYRKGIGVVMDLKKADYWYRKALPWYNQAAEQGDADAQFHLGVMYARGHGVSKNPKQALYWLGKAAQQGHKEAKDTLKNQSQAGDLGNDGN